MENKSKAHNLIFLIFIFLDLFAWCHDVAVGFDAGSYPEVSGNTLYNIDYPVMDYDRQPGSGCGDHNHTNVIFTLNQSDIFENRIHDVGVNGFTISPHPCWSGGAYALSRVYENLLYSAKGTGHL